MDTEIIMKQLRRLAKAAQAQGQYVYDHRAALEVAGITERGDALQPLISAWCKALPLGYTTIGHFVDTMKPTGNQMARMFLHAASTLISVAEPFTMEGPSMQAFADLHIVKSDGTSTRFVDVVKGFTIMKDETLQAAVLRAAFEVEPDAATVIFLPKKEAV